VIIKTAIITLTLLFSAACSRQPAQDQPQTRIDWDSWGVAHIFAQSDEEAFFADGWAQMHSHANTILRLYGVSRGRAAEYWGEQYLDSDRLVHTLGNPQRAQAMWELQDPELKDLLSAFIAGMNAYAGKHPEAINDENRVVLPLSVHDVNMHSQFVVNTRFVAGRELGMSQRWDENGSNAYAVAPSRSQAGHAMLVQNPHLPWAGEFLFYEKHVVTSASNIYGAHLVGMPGLAIAFNDQLGWSHTNNPIDNADLYQLTLEGDGYQYDGATRAFEETAVTLQVKQDDGGFSEKEIKVQRSIHGPVIRKGESQALALRYVGNNSHNSLLQWWRMANSASLKEFESALKMAQIPFWNVMYADRDGNIMYLFNGHVPVRSHGDWPYWQGLVPGNDSANLWTEVHPYEDLPRTLNPATGWLQNANDPPWTSTIPQVLNANDFPAYMSPERMSFRPQSAAKMMLADESISFEELLAYKHSTKLEMADRILDDLLSAVDEYGTDIGIEAGTVLREWDRHADNDSRGAVLFQNWAFKMSPYDPKNYALAWDGKHAVSTPDGLREPERMVRLLEAAAQEMKKQYGRLDIAWGEVNRIEYNGHSLPANGASSALGVFRVAQAGAMKDGVQSIRHGDSWVGVIEFADTPRAKVLLSYGNSTQKGSRHYGDQLKLFSEKRLRDAWRTEQQLQGHIDKTERLLDGVFIEQH